MDALGTAVGVASLGIQICQSILSYYDGWKGYHADISNAYKSVEDLAQTFTILKTSLLTSATDGKENSECRVKVETCLSSCVEGLHRLQKRLSKLRNHAVPQGLRQKTWAEMQRAWYPLRASTVAKLKEDVSELRESLSLALQTLQQITLDQGLSRVTNEMAELLLNQQAAEGKISNVLSSQRADRRKAIIDWLFPPDPCYNHDAARSRCVQGTGGWLLQSVQYKHWKESTNSMLCLTGKAGSGKTVLCSTVIEDLRALPDTRLAFFYFSFSDVRKQSHASLLASLTTQLLRDGPAYDKLQQVYDKIYPSRPSAEILEDMLSICLQQRGQTILVLDALDELPESDNGDGRPAILAWLERVVQASPAKVFVTTRPLHEIETVLTSFNIPFVALREKFADDDIRTYVATELEKHYKLRNLKADIKGEIKEVFERKSDGMFRWAHCQLGALKALKSTKPNFIRKVLHDLPRSLDETYERMLLQIDENLAEEALAALRWLTFETRPLTLGELSEACLIDHVGEKLVDVDNKGQPDDILEILAGLILVEDSHMDDSSGDGEHPDMNGDQSSESYIRPINTNSRVRLAHFSVKEYLLSSRILNSQASQFALEKKRDLSILAQSCLAYVLYYSQSSSKTSSEQDLAAYPLLRYAAAEWIVYLQESGQMQSTHLVQLLESEEHRRNWTMIYRPDEPWIGPFRYGTEFGSGLYYASYLGLVSTCRTLLDRGADVNAQGGIFDSALAAASARNHLEVVRILLDMGANVNAQGDNYKSALYAASKGGHLEVVQLLLDSGADVNVQGSYFNSALCAASVEGHREVVQLLLDSKANHGGALQLASWLNHIEIVQLLLDNGADVNTREGFLDSALHAASKGGHLDVVQLLLDSGADVTTQDDYGNALEAASAQGHREVVQLLLDRRADVNTQGDNYDSALQAASERGHQEVMQLTVDTRAPKV